MLRNAVSHCCSEPRVKYLCIIGGQHSWTHETITAGVTVVGSGSTVVGRRKYDLSAPVSIKSRRYFTLLISLRFTFIDGNASRGANLHCLNPGLRQANSWLQFICLGDALLQAGMSASVCNVMLSLTHLLLPSLQRNLSLVPVIEDSANA